MREMMKPVYYFSLASALLVVYVAPSWADIIIYNGAGAVQPDENLTFSDFNQPVDQSGTTVLGSTNQTNRIVETTSVEMPPVTLTTPSGGQARIEGFGGVLYNSIEMHFDDPQIGFTELEFNLNVADGGILELMFDVFNTNTMMSEMITTTLATDNSSLSLNDAGNNFFGIEAINGQFITSVKITSLQGGVPTSIIEDIRQIRITGGVIDDDDDDDDDDDEDDDDNGGVNGGNVVPEPASIATWGVLAGIGLIVAARRRKSPAA